MNERMSVRTRGILRIRRSRLYAVRPGAEGTSTMMLHDDACG